MVQELVDKQEKLPKDIEWHLIGHLQTNKVKYIAPFISMIHSVDSMKLLMEINKQALKNNRVIDCLLQLEIADEDTKYGMDLAEAVELLRSDEFKQLKFIELLSKLTASKSKSCSHLGDPSMCFTAVSGWARRV